MGLFQKKCEYCRMKIDKGKEVVEAVKVPELTGTRSRFFCSEKHAEKYKLEVKGTPRRNFCPSCGV